MDHQVKIRGFRIELEEIENQLLNHNQVKEAVVVTKPAPSPGEQYLCAYIVPHQDIDNTRLREYLSWTLPHYMIPSHFVTMEKLPLTPSGKLDQRALPVPVAKSEAAYTAPKNITEEKLTQLWNEILGIEKSKIGIDDSFFELGGHSLKATIMLAKIHSHFNVRVPLTEIFKTPTIQSLAKYININLINGEIPLKKDDHVVLLKKGLTKANHLFFIHDGSGEVEGYVEFCQCMDAELDLNCWGIRADNLKNHTPQNLTIEEIAGKYIRKIKSLQPQGPYFIVGWSLGGTIAFEMTRQLEMTKEDIAFLSLIDSPSPQDCAKENVPTFTLESEKDFIKKYLPGRRVQKKLAKITGINKIWPFIIDYLEAKHFNVEIIRKVVVEYEAHVVPNYHQLSISELTEYLNLGRTLYNARASYIPSGKIHTPVHYFAASQSRDIIKESWNEYCRKPIMHHEIIGDHFSIFKKPEVIGFTKIFARELKSSR
jgi:thioesterase domain-containing protein/acyl carrier protein